MYCVNCGVKLADSEAVCPLCNTRAYHPDIKRQASGGLYPEKYYPKPINFSFLGQIVMTCIMLIAGIVVLLCDMEINRELTWSGFVVGALITGYVIFILPLWFKDPNPVIFVPCGFAVSTVYLLYIDLVTKGGWFLSFAFPTVSGIAVIVTAVIALLRYVKRGALYIFGGALVALGAFMMLVELFASITFKVAPFLWWSLYPLSALAIIGMFLIFLAICRPAREMMERKFFI